MRQPQCEGLQSPAGGSGSPTCSRQPPPRGKQRNGAAARQALGARRGGKRPHLPQCWILCPAAACARRQVGLPEVPHAAPCHIHTSGPGSTRSWAQVYSQAYTLRQVYTGAQRGPQIQNCRHVLTSTSWTHIGVWVYKGGRMSYAYAETHAAHFPAQYAQ